MDDIQLIVYILIVAFGIFSRFLKAKKKAPKSQAPADERPSKKPSVSFEELLKEFTGEDSTEPELEEAAEPRKVERKAMIEYDDDEIQQRYQESLKKAESYKSKSEKVVQQDDRHTGNFTHFRGYDEFEKEEEESEFLTFLREEDGPRKAIILGEILNRRY